MVSQVLQHQRCVEHPADLRFGLRPRLSGFSSSVDADAIVWIAKDVQTNGTAVKSVELVLGENYVSVVPYLLLLSGA